MSGLFYAVTFHVLYHLPQQEGEDSRQDEKVEMHGSELRYLRSTCRRRWHLARPSREFT